MRRNCHLELRLVPPQSPFIFSDHHRVQESPSWLNVSVDRNMAGGDLKEKQNQQLTIFYDGKVSVCNVTELQAMAIIKAANEVVMDDDKWRKPELMICSQGGVSMKRSLQTFLQKRKHRIQSTSPY